MNCLRFETIIIQFQGVCNITAVEVMFGGEGGGVGMYCHVMCHHLYIVSDLWTCVM